MKVLTRLPGANYMASLEYVDADNIGIFGWSYGGYETLMAMSQNNSPYLCWCCCCSCYRLETV